MDRVDDVDLDTLCAEVDIPYIENTLPILVAAFEKCRSIWSDIYVDYVLGGHIILDEIGEKMYPDGGVSC